mgnify:CR=1 FL=1
MVTGGRNSTQGAVSSRKLHRNRRPVPGRAYHSIRRSPSQRERQNPGRAARAEPGNPKKKSNRLSGIRSRRRVQPAAPTWQTQASTPQPQPRAPGQDRGKAVPVEPGGCQIEQAAPEGQRREQDDPAQRIEQEKPDGKGEFIHTGHLRTGFRERRI